MFFTVENAVDLHSVGIPLMLEMAVGGRHKDTVKEVSLCHSMTSFFNKFWSAFVRSFVCDKPKVKLMHNCNHKEHYRKKKNVMLQA
jgi:hypothetical protein